MMELIHENDFANANYDRSRFLVQTQYVGIAHVQPIVELLRKVMEHSGKEKVRAMRANLTRMQGTFTEAMEFFEKEFYPTMIKNGLLSYAIVVSNDAFTKYAATQLRKKAGNVDFHIYQNLEEADQWIASKAHLHV